MLQWCAAYGEPALSASARSVPAHCTLREGEAHSEVRTLAAIY